MIANSTYSALQIKARTDEKFLILTTNDSVKQMHNNRDRNFIYSDSTLNDHFFPNLFYDDARLMGYFYKGNIFIYRVDNSVDDVPNPRYTLKF
jgi:hypothetical protein